MTTVLLVLQLFILGWLYLIGRDVNEIRAHVRQLRGIDPPVELPERSAAATHPHR